MYLFISSLTGKGEQIAQFKEIISAKDEEIADLKEKLSELEQNRHEKGVDFAKQLRTADEELKKTKENIFLAKENILKKKAELEKIPKALQVFNGKSDFHISKQIELWDRSWEIIKVTYLSAITACEYSCAY